jgi:hypothetical protein
LNLLPLPQRLSLHPGRLRLRGGNAPRITRIRKIQDQGPEAYTLRVDPRGVRIEAGDPRGFFYAGQTLDQLLRREARGGSLPCLEIKDWPAFPVRGLSVDVSRGRVPKLEALFELVDGLASLKINQLQLYIEHTFSFASYPMIGRGASALRPAQIRALDAYARARHIELVPCFAALGHLSKILGLPPYRRYAEDWGLGRYEVPASRLKFPHNYEPGWTLAPGQPDGLRFLDELFGDFLPCFSSRRFNVCCDEPFDLGLGRSRKAVQAKGMEAVFAGHVRALSRLAARHGKREILVWSDMLRHHPGTTALLPQNAVVLDWQYGEDSDFGSLAQFTRERETWACPSTNSWGSFFPRLPMALANLQGEAEAAARLGARGFLNTLWGDGGHFNSPELEWHGVARGAELAWNPGVPPEGYSARWAAAFLGIGDPGFAGALEALGEEATRIHHGGVENLWTACVFAPESDPIFRGRLKGFYRSVEGRVIRADHALDRPTGLEALKRIAPARAALARAFAARDERGHGEAWLLGADWMTHGARKWALLSGGRKLRAAERALLAGELTGLTRRFQALWERRSRPSEIGRTLSRLRRSLGAGHAVE